MRLHFSIHILVVSFLLGCFYDLQANARTVFVGRAADVPEVLSHPNNKYVFFYDYDLNGRSVKLGPGCSLVFRGGSLKHGVLIGEGSSIKASAKSEIFNEIRIEGTWNCPIVYSNWFADITETNGIGNLFALTNDNVYNIVHIKKGFYSIEHSTYDSTPFRPRSKSAIILDGTIVQRPSQLAEYYLVYLKDVNDVTITGKGEIVGDKHSHPNSVQGEKGHGVAIQNSRKVLIKGITVKDCWGDCIYVGFSATNRDITIDGCIIENGRRTGIAIVNADGFTVRNCTIKDIEGTPTEYGIDVEPNAHPSHICKNGLIEKNKFDTKFGLYIQSQKNDPTEYIVVRNNAFNCSSRAITLTGGNKIQIKNNTIVSDVAVYFARIGNVDLKSFIENNSIDGTVRGNVREQWFLGNTIKGICYFEEGCDKVIFESNHCFGLVNFAKGSGGNIINSNVFEYPLEVQMPSSMEGNTCKDVVSLTGCNFMKNTINVSNPNMNRQNVVIHLDNCKFSDNIVKVDVDGVNSISSVFRLSNRPSVLEGNTVDSKKTQKRLFSVDESMEGASSLKDNRFDVENSKVLSDSRKLRIIGQKM